MGISKEKKKIADAARYLRMTATEAGRARIRELRKKAEVKRKASPQRKAAASKYKKSENGKAVAKIQRGTPQAKAEFFRKRIRSKYGLEVTDYEGMRERQERRCAICGLPEEAERYGRLSVDHDHDTNQVRALLCDRCNTGLGKFRDSAELLELAAAYLKVYRG